MANKFLDNKSKIFLLSIDNVDLSDYLTQYDIDMYDITSENTGMNAKGKTIIDYVLKDKVKISLKWEGCTSAYIDKIQDALKNGTCSCVYVIGDKKVTGTISSYRGDRKISMKRNDNNVITWDFSTSIISLAQKNH